MVYGLIQTQREAPKQTSTQELEGSCNTPGVTQSPGQRNTLCPTQTLCYNGKEGTKSFKNHG
jgi:hypothetical protein